MADGDGVIVEDIYQLAGVVRTGFLLRITIPPGSCTISQTYDDSYVIYPLTDGTLEIYEDDEKKEDKKLKVGEFYRRPISNSVSIRVCNPKDSDYDIVILKG